MPVVFVYVLGWCQIWHKLNEICNVEKFEIFFFDMSESFKKKPIIFPNN
jgi:hypothetical protein